MKSRTRKTPRRPRAVFRWEDGGQRRWLFFSSPGEVLEAARPADVTRILKQAEKHAGGGGWAVGYLAYEAAPAFDASFRVRDGGGLPLARFELFSSAEEIASPFDLPGAGFELGRWRPTIKRSRYEETVKGIKSLIAAGDTYQVNFTFRLRAGFRGDPLAFWLKLLSAQPDGRPAFIDAGRFAVLSVSPEIFFHRDAGGNILCRPMKGTARRGLTNEDEAKEIRKLSGSGKNRAENLMIVDMIRNDLSRIAPPGRVRVKQLFSVERHPTLLQMTSTVEAYSPASLPDLMAALFPCASITGAPKIRAMEIISETETEPRGVYTGAIGAVGPGGEARFNVAIRTAVADLEDGRVEYGTGGGIVWGSRPRAEYAEAILKSSILTAAAAEFELLETIRWESRGGYFLLEGHLRRLNESGRYFGFPVDTGRVAEDLRVYAADLSSGPRLVRLRLDRRGRVLLENRPLPAREKPRRLAVALRPVDRRDPFLYHKTTRREIYDRAREERPGYDDVILFNRRREITETTRANIVFQAGGKYYTPPVSCGLLGGVFRSHLLASGRIGERTLTLEKLGSCEKIFLINSVRKWMRVASIESNPPGL